MSKAANHFFKQYQNKLIGGINTCLIGVIENYDAETNKADVSLPDGELITNVPVGAIQTAEFFIRVPYTPGDYVLVVFSQRDIDGIMNEGDETPTDRMLSLDDAIVVCGINLFNDPLPSNDLDKLVIAQKDGAASIIMGGGEIHFGGNKVFVNGTELKAGGSSF